jgi:predicted Rossmann fold flavoprotein
MCAIESGKRGRSVAILERNRKIGEKIRISGGGRCNFTNVNVDPANFLSQNPHFMKSALARYTSADFIGLVEKHKIAYHEKKLGQLFCDGGSQQIIDMLMNECSQVSVVMHARCDAIKVTRKERFEISTSIGDFTCQSLVVATGGLSIPQLGATNYAFSLARQYGVRVTRLKPGLVPLTFQPEDLKLFGALAGISVDATVSCSEVSFRENILFTHRGLSGPSILQVSSYWDEGLKIIINLLPGDDAMKLLLAHHQTSKELSTVLDQHLPRRFAVEWCQRLGGSKPMNRYASKELDQIGYELNHWEITPDGTEGFGKAEVTVGGVDTDELSSKTMETRKVSGLYFIGECVDVTGWLGGYNFQWAWSSGWVAGQYV